MDRRASHQDYENARHEAGREYSGKSLVQVSAITRAGRDPLSELSKRPSAP